MVLIEMLAIDGGDHCDDWGKQEKRAVTFVSFHDHVFAFTDAGVRAEMIHAAADDEGGIQTGGIENRRNHRSGGGLSVGPGNCDSVLQAHQFSEHFGARNYRDFQAVRFEQFDVCRILRPRK